MARSNSSAVHDQGECNPSGLSPVIPAKAGIHRSERSAPPTRSDSSEILKAR
jgi:hypothetical protein